MTSNTPKQDQEPVTSMLLPCPFCGSSGDMLRLCDTRPTGTCWISCDICEMEGPPSTVGRDPAGAAEAWNTRAPQPDKALPDREALTWLEQQARDSATGISFDYVHARDGEPSGFRFMRRHHIGQPCATIEEAIRQNGGPA